MMADVRIEHDAFGPVEVPADHWRAQTQCALDVFEVVGGGAFPCFPDPRL